MIFRALLAALLAFFGIQAPAQTAPILGCHPNNFLTPWGKGSDYHYVETDKASGRFVWCKQADGGWNIHTWQYWVHDAKPANSWNANDAEKRVKKKAQAATSGVVSLADAASAAIEAEFAAARVAPNEMQRYERARLKHKACLEMTAKPYPVIPPGGFADLPANWCDGFKPGDPPPPEAGWKAYGGTIYRHVDGKLTGVVSGKTAAKDAPCTGLTVSTAGTFVYQELAGGVAGEATRCVKP